MATTAHSNKTSQPTAISVSGAAVTTEQIQQANEILTPAPGIMVKHRWSKPTTRWPRRTITWS